MTSDGSATSGPANDRPESSAASSISSAAATSSAPSVAGPGKPTAYSTDGVLEVCVGTALWFIALIVSLALHSTLRDHGYLWFIPTAAFGTGVGVLGILYCRKRSAAIAAGGTVDLF